MDSSTAQNLFVQGSTYWQFAAFLDVPEGTEFGIDYHRWHVGPRFKGVKMIPPGLHYFHFSVVNRREDTRQSAPRVGFFKFLHQGEVRHGSLSDVM